MSKLRSPALLLGPKAAPLLMYGTAWKESKTAELSETALKAGFRAIDTANYPTGYNEPLTGDGIAAAIKSGIKREDLFIQTKFTPAWAHDKGKLPFNQDQDLEGQIRESIEQSFQHLKVDYIDALLLHAPFQDEEDNVRAWPIFESYVPHRIGALGVSNFALPQLARVFQAATVKPVIVQNRFYKETSFDPGVRAFCKEHGILYQAFWMLSHNPEVMESDVVAAVAEKLHVEKAVAFYVLILGLRDTQVLDGTTKPERMVADLKAAEELVSKPELLDSLQPSVEEFETLLEKLAAEDRAKV